MGKDAIILLAMRVGGTLLWMGYTIILARTLPQEDFAWVLYAINFSLISVLAITMGRNMALLRMASRAWESGSGGMIRDLLARSRRAVSINGAVLTSGLLAASVLGLDTPVTQTPGVAVLTGLITLAAAQMGLHRDILFSVGRAWQAQLGFNVTRTIVPIAGSAVAYFSFGMNAEIALVLFLLSLILSLALEVVFLRQVEWGDGPHAEATDHEELVRSGLALWPGEMANAAQMRIAGLISGFFLPVDAIALFLAAERIANLAQFPIMAASQASAPYIARSTALGETQTQRELVKASLLVSAGALIGVMLAAVAAWPALWALGPEYIPAFPVVLILLTAHLSWALFGVASLALNLAGSHAIYRNISVFMALASAVLVLLAARSEDPECIAWAYGAAWWGANILYTVFLYRSAGLRTGILAVGPAFSRWMSRGRS